MASFKAQGKSLHLFLNISFLLLLLFYSTTRLNSSHSFLLQRLRKPNPVQSSDDSDQGCNDLDKFGSSESKCAYIISESGCNPEGYIHYLHLFYCICGKHPILGYTVLIFWLFVLFYLLGNTAANYFCSNLEGLSKLLKLTPTIAGVTLLSLGNGAPDVFSSIVSFMGTNSTNLVGLNSILGGAFFVSSVVVGIVSICIAPKKIVISKSGFVRDTCFLLFALLALLAILVIGRINIWGAVAFASLYLVYVFLVSITHLYGREKQGVSLFDDNSLLPIKGELGAPLLIAIEKSGGGKPHNCYCCYKILCFLELPLYLPRRLTIPDVSEETWSKPFAVISVTLAPMLLAALWGELDCEEGFIIYLFGGLVGIFFGITTFVKTEKESPPTKFLFPWFVGGFLMSVTWTYIIAEELVSLLVSLGVILRISSSILGLTVLAWGNSLGDLIANVAVAVNGGPAGAQVAISGCYGGPIFNTLVGLGLSLVFCSWFLYPTSMPIPNDPTLFQTLGFLMAGLLWALVILPRRGMKLDKALGYGLIAIYLCFLSVRLGQVIGLIDQLQ